jgi:hypothetical protein
MNVGVEPLEAVGRPGVALGLGVEPTQAVTMRATAARAPHGTRE